MTRLVILGDNLASLCGANHALDMNPEMEIQIITERAEIGLVEEIQACYPRGRHVPPTGYPKWGLRLPNRLLRLFEGPGFRRQWGYSWQKEDASST